MNYKCLGCGVVLQNKDKNSLGYTSDIEKKYCERCFRIKNYNEYQKIDLPIHNFYKIIDKINQTDDLVLLVIDIMSVGRELNKLVEKLNRKPLVIISKRDIFSYKIQDKKLFNLINFSCLDKIAISSNKNYNLDLLMTKISQYQTSKNVFVPFISHFFFIVSINLFGFLSFLIFSFFSFFSFNFVPPPILHFFFFA